MAFLGSDHVGDRRAACLVTGHRWVRLHELVKCPIFPDNW